MEITVQSCSLDQMFCSCRSSRMENALIKTLWLYKFQSLNQFFYNAERGIQIEAGIQPSLWLLLLMPTAEPRSRY